MAVHNVPWIINNMIWDSTEMTKLRQPSELELKVQKSLQQLTVPDWYTNKSIASPKIIVDRRPFEIRPAPWKDPVRNRASLKNTKNKAMANTAAVTPVMENKKLHDPELMEELWEAKNVWSTKSPPSYSSGTFPKISPSRRIQNINIVFPSKSPCSEKSNIESEDNKISPEKNFLENSIMSIESMDKFTPQRMSSLENQLTSVTGSTPIEIQKSKISASQVTPKIQRMKCPPPAAPRPLSSSKRGGLNFGNETFISPRKFTDAQKILHSPVIRPEDTGSVTPIKTGKIKRMNCPAPPVPVTPVKISANNGLDFSDESFLEKSLFLTPKKSTEMEKIIKNEQKLSSGKSFVEEIIQELNAKCSPKVKSNYVSPTSKNFVKKLVRALEMGNVPKYDEDDRVSEGCSDTECKSNPSSTSVSIKDSDSGSGSDSENKSLTSQVSSYGTFRSFSMALEKGRSGKISRKSIEPYIDDDDQSVYWIPLPNCKLPRTSSLKNMMSTLSLSDSDRSSPISSSPDSDGTEQFSSSWQPTDLQNSNRSGWGRTFDKRRSRQLFRIDETNVIDSGYSDRSETNSSSSSVFDESHWYADAETTQTASENDNTNNENNNFSHVHRCPIVGCKSRYLNLNN